MSDIPSFDDYVASLGHLTTHADPTAPSKSASDVSNAARSLSDLDTVTAASLSAWVEEHPKWVPVLGLAVGLTQEKLKMALKNHFDTSGWQTLARKRPQELIALLDEKYDLVRLVIKQRHRNYEFGDVLIARAGSRLTATRAGASGRKVEDEIEAIAKGLGLPAETRTRFIGRRNRSAPCDLAIPGGGNADIAVAAKGFDSTGSKLTDAVREVEEMAEVRTPRQFVIAVIDGIGWKSRINDLRRIYNLWIQQDIDGMYSLASLEQFKHDIEDAARLKGLLP